MTLVAGHSIECERRTSSAMPDPLADVRGVLAELADDELEVLFATSWLRPAPCIALLAWIEHAADWEMNRRKGFDFHLEPPDEAIDPSDDQVAISAAIVLHDEYAGDSAIALFFAATVDILIGRGHCPQSAAEAPPFAQIDADSTGNDH